jgi:hypothetical protein
MSRMLTAVDNIQSLARSDSTRLSSVLDTYWQTWSMTVDEVEEGMQSQEVQVEVKWGARHQPCRQPEMQPDPKRRE